MKKSLLSLFLASTMLLLVACGGETAPTGTPSGSEGTPSENSTAVSTTYKDKGNIVVHNINSEPKTIDPALNSSTDGAVVIVNIFEGLTTNEFGTIVPGIAESWDISEDGLVYTFKLRDANWSDGKPVTAGDFVYSWRRVIDPKVAAEYAYQMEYIVNGTEILAGKEGMTPEDLGVKALDDKTLEVTLVNRTPYFLELCAFPCYLPVREDIVEANPEKWTYDMENFISNGPFKMKEWKHNDSIELVKNEEYYNKDAVSLDGIKLVMVTELSTAVSGFEAGDIDYTEMPPEQIPVYEDRNDPSYNNYPYLGVYYITFNNEKAPFDNKLVRQAFTLAIDKDALARVVTKGGETPAVGYVPKGVFLSDGSDFRDVAGNYDINTTGDIERAKALLAEAGYPDGKDFPKIEYLFNSSEKHKAVGEALQQMWKVNLGVDVTLRNEEWAVFQSTRRSGDYVFARHGWIGDYADPMTFLDLFQSTSDLNDPNFKNDEFDKQIQLAKSSVGKERDQALLNADKILNDEQAMAPLHYYTKPALKVTNLKDSYVSPLGFVYYRDAKIER